MKNMKFVIIIFSVIIMLGIIFVLYANIMAFGNQTISVTKSPKELKELEHDIQVETFDKDANFDDVPEHEFQNCNVKLGIHLYVSNDSITKTKKALDLYILSINKRVNSKLKDKKCLDSLIVDVSSYYSQAEPDDNNLKAKHYRYSFSIK